MQRAVKTQQHETNRQDQLKKTLTSVPSLTSAGLTTRKQKADERKQRILAEKEEQKIKARSKSGAQNPLIASPAITDHETAEAMRQGLCIAYLKGACKKSEKDCKYKHAQVTPKPVASGKATDQGRTGGTGKSRAPTPKGKKIGKLGPAPGKTVNETHCAFERSKGVPASLERNVSSLTTR